MSTKKQIPDAPVTDVYINKRSGIRTVEIRCPYCHGTHTHGWPMEDAPGTAIGHRVAHCVASGGYNIVITEAAA